MERSGGIAPIPSKIFLVAKEGAMITVMSDVWQIEIPSWVNSLDSFRRWVISDKVPENCRVCFLNGKVWIDMSKE
jgi:hypothetical protein